MQVFVNGAAHELTSEPVTLATLLDSLGIEQTSCATAVNGQFVARTLRDQTRLTANDQIMTFEPITGG